MVALSSVCLVFLFIYIHVHIMYIYIYVYSYVHISFSLCRSLYLAPSRSLHLSVVCSFSRSFIRRHFALASVLRKLSRLHERDAIFTVGFNNSKSYGHILLEYQLPHMDLEMMLATIEASIVHSVQHRVERFQGNLHTAPSFHRRRKPLFRLPPSHIVTPCSIDHPASSMFNCVKL